MRSLQNARTEKGYLERLILLDITFYRSHLRIRYVFAKSGAIAQGLESFPGFNCLKIAKGVKSAGEPGIEISFRRA